MPHQLADLIVIHPGDWPGDVAEFLVTAARPADIRRVFVGGRQLTA